MSVLIKIMISKELRYLFSGSCKYFQNKHELLSIYTLKAADVTHVHVFFKNNFHVFKNLHDIDFASSCMDVLAINAPISMNVNSMLNFVELNRIFCSKTTYLISLMQGVQ